MKWDIPDYIILFIFGDQSQKQFIGVLPSFVRSCDM